MKQKLNLKDKINPYLNQLSKNFTTQDLANINKDLEIFTQCIALVLGIRERQWRLLKRLLTLCTSLYDEPGPFCAFRNALYLNNIPVRRSRLPFFACKNV